MSVHSATAAVFLSYASQDAPAARRLADALGTAGVEVWFDQNELVGGDAWDAKIRAQIAACTLFVPLISASTQARREGYFRLEWKLAAQRTHMMSERAAFILPVVLDGTRDGEADVPTEFRAVQWTRLPDGHATPAFITRIQRLAGAPVPPAAPASELSASPVVTTRPPRPVRPILAGVIALFCLAFALFYFSRPPSTPNAPAAANGASVPSPASAPVIEPAPSEAVRLAEQARTLIDGLDSTRTDYQLAEELITRAKEKDPLDGRIHAVESLVHQRYLQRGWDVGDARHEAARTAAQRALRLDPTSFDARFTQAWLLDYHGNFDAEKEKALRALLVERPDSRPVLRALSRLLSTPERLEESLALSDHAAALPGGDPLALYDKSQTFWWAGRAAEADRAIQAALAQKPFAGALLMAAWYRVILHGDLGGARNYLDQIPPDARLEDRATFFIYYNEILARRPQEAIAALSAMPRDWISDFFYSGPKGLLVGDALMLAGRPSAAVVEWTASLRLVEEKLAGAPNDWSMLQSRFALNARLGHTELADHQLQLLLQARGLDPRGEKALPKWATLGLLRTGKKSDALRHLSLGLKLRTRGILYTAAILKLDPSWDALRAEPAFAALIAEAEAFEADDALAVDIHPTARP